MKKNGRAIGGYLMNHNCKKYGTVVTGLLNQNGRLTCQSHSFMPDGNVIASTVVVLSNDIHSKSRERETALQLQTKGQLLQELYVIYN